METKISLHLSTDSDPSICSDILALAPHLIWAAVVVFVLLWIGRHNIVAVLQRVEKVAVGGVEFQLRDGIRAAARDRRVDLSDDEIGAVSRRLAANTELLHGAKLLWVDDHPELIVRESKVLEKVGAQITRVTSSNDAFSKIEQCNYDLVLSDIRRGDDANAGIAFGQSLVLRADAPPLIFYVGDVEKPTPEIAFGITNNPSELLHLVVDALSRVRA
jgi:CheY-like chemotaxis protein